MRLGCRGLETLLSSHVVELRFRRRIPRVGSLTRRMFCTKDLVLLTSKPGMAILNYKPPKGIGLAFEPSAKNLVVAWDIFMQDWRMINCNDVNVISFIKTKPTPEAFWKYFFEKIMPMTTTQKVQFLIS